MKEVFGSTYANLYDALYQDKDYVKECNFIEEIFKDKKINVKKILDLGCGTGSHDIILAQRGYSVTGIDKSGHMLKIARQKIKENNLKVKFIQGDVTITSFTEKFDAVISMFAVMSYQVTNKELEAFCKTARKHLKEGGIFIADFWNGLAVLEEKPIPKIKEVQLRGRKIIRTTMPILNLVDHRVDIIFHTLEIKDTEIISEVKETHRMRFIFPKEIQYYLKCCSFKEVQFCPFMKLRTKLSSKDWIVTVIAIC